MLARNSFGRCYLSLIIGISSLNPKIVLSFFHLQRSRRFHITTACKMSDPSSVIHFNHAGASPSPDSVIQKVVDHMYLEQRLGGYAAAEDAKEELVQVYERTAKLLHAGSAAEIALVESSTVAWTRLFYAMVEYHERLRKENNTKKTILISEAEYAAQVVAAIKFTREHEGWSVVAIPSAVSGDGTSTGVVDMLALKSMLEGTYKINGGRLDPDSIAVVCVTHVPTNSGIINPVQDIGELLHEYNSNSFYLVDACQSVGQMDVNVKKLRCHGLCGTGRKYLRAPRGTGFLYVDEGIVSLLEPSHIDHACAPIRTVPSKVSSSVDVEYSFQEGAKRFEFWEFSAAAKLGFGEAVRFAMDDTGGANAIAEKIHAIGLELQKQLQAIEGIEIYYPGTRSGIITFRTSQVEPENLKEHLWEVDNFGNQFEVSVVPATSTPLDTARTKVKNLVRASVSYTTTQREVLKFCERLQQILGEN